MRLQLPRSIPTKWVLIYAGLVFFAQQVEHTSLALSLLYFGFLMLAATSFNLAGGLPSVIGSYVFWYWLFTCSLPFLVKIVLNQPADSNLNSPLLDMAAYTSSMAMLLLVVWILKTFNLKPYALATSRLINPAVLNYGDAAWGFLLVSAFVIVMRAFFPAPPGSALSAISFLNPIFLPLAAVFATIEAVRSSGGRRTVNAASLLSMGLAFFFGLLGYSKEGLMSPLVCWLVAAAYCRLRLRLVHYVFISAMMAFALFFISAWSVGRDTVPEDGAGVAERFSLAIFNLQHFDILQSNLQDQEANNGITGYFGRNLGIFDRLNMIEVDDALNAYTDQGHYEGYAPITQNFANWAPHFLYPNKPIPINGNTYAREIGTFLPEDDTTTGISFTPVAEAYHIDGWTGVFILLPVIWLLLFGSLTLIVGDERVTPWALFLVVYFVHAAPETNAGVLVMFTLYGNAALVAAIVFSSKIAPVLRAALVPQPATLRRANASGKT